MVERVARAINPAAMDCPDGDVFVAAMKMICRQQASAALEAMRSPTDEMLHIGDEAVDTCTKVDPCLTPAKHIWADMITAALGDG